MLRICWRLGRLSWSRPPYGVVKLNFDGNCLGIPGVVVVGGLVRDHDSRVLSMYSGYVG